MHEGLKFDEIKQKRACAGCARVFSGKNMLAQGGQRQNRKIKCLPDVGKCEIEK